MTLMTLIHDFPILGVARARSPIRTFGVISVISVMDQRPNSRTHSIW